MKEVLKIGFVGTAISPYYAEEQEVRKNSEVHLKKILENFDVELISFHKTIFSKDDSVEAENLLKNKVDFLLIQTSSCSSGEQLYPLCNISSKIGVWAVPDIEKEGGVKLHSLVSTSHYLGIIKKTLSKRKIKTKWFYNYADTDEFKNKFLITVKSLIAQKKLKQSRIGLIGGISPGFDNMIVDNDKIKQNIGTIIDEATILELVDKAKNFKQSLIDEEIKKIKNAATDITVSDDDSFNKVTRVYFALKQIREENNWESLAVQCWSQFQELYGIAPCMAYGWMGSEDGIAVSCEGDVQGAISMLLLNYISNTEKSSTLLDLATFDREANAVLMWHCGVSPRHFANEDGIKWVDHSTLGRKTEKKYGIAGDQVFKAQSSTTTYLGNNAERLLVLNSEIFNHTNKGYDGTRGWFKETKLNRLNISAENLINTLNMIGHEHHYAVGQGNHSKELLEFAAWNDLKLIDEIPLVDYISPKDNESNNFVI
jgi:L-fucose isomerase-like protein